MDALPTLSPEGFTTNKTIMMLKLYEYFLSSDYSQSNTFLGRIASLKYILNEAGTAEELKTMVESALLEMYTAYFRSVVIDITINETDNSMTLDVNISCLDQDDVSYKLSEIVNVVDNKITNFDKHQEVYSDRGESY